MRIILDTNIFLVSIPKNSKYRIIFDKFLAKQFTLILSNDILTEYTEIISQKANSIVAANIAEMLMTAGNVEKIEIFYNWQLIDIDKDDNKFVDCAIAANADYIVSNDKHFEVLKSIEFPVVKVINIENFIKLLIQI